MKTLCTLLILLLPITLNAKEIAITFDDAPRKATGYFDGSKRAELLIAALKKHNVPQVAFFAVSQHLNSEGIERLNQYAEAGHIIANHTHSHLNFNQTSLDEYIHDFMQAEKSLKSFKNYKKYFRFPYLREGDTLNKRDGMRSVLADKGYINAYITANNYDWYLESLFQKAILEEPELDFESLRKFYVEVLMESIEYYDQLAVEYLKRSPKHVLLLHETDLAALFIGDLIDELRKRGWKIISLENAYKDELSKEISSKVFKYNPGRIAEVANKNGKTKGLWHLTLNEKYLEERFRKEVKP